MKKIKTMEINIDRSKYNDFEAFYEKFKEEFTKLQQFRDYWQDKISESAKPQYSDDDFVEVAGLKFYKEYMSGGDCNINPNNDVSYYNFDQAQNRAREIGLHIPTPKQFQQLYDGTYHIFTKEGMYFVDKETGKSILFNYYGYRDNSNGSLVSVGEYGYCWSSSVYSSGYGYSLGFTSGYVYPQGSNSRRYGFPVRCVLN